MRINDPKLIAELPRLGVEHKPGIRLAEKTSLEIGGASDVLLMWDPLESTCRHASLSIL